MTDNQQRAADGQRCSHCSAEWVKDMERHLQRHVEVAAAALRRIEELHSPVDEGLGPVCQGCATHATFTRWPCKTIAALRGEHRYDPDTCRCTCGALDHPEWGCSA